MLCFWIGDMDYKNSFRQLNLFFVFLMQTFWLIYSLAFNSLTILKKGKQKSHRK